MNKIEHVTEESEQYSSPSGHNQNKIHQIHLFGASLELS